MPIKVSYKQLIDQANSEIKTYTPAQIKARLATDPKMQLIDIRDIRELQAPAGTPVGSVHAPRGMIEFWVDPSSPYFKPMWGDESKEFILFCAAGWRSALTTKTLQDMGMTNVAHIDGGFEEMAKAGFAMESLEQRKANKA